MAETLSVRLNAGVRRRLSYGDIEWQRREIAEGIKDLDAGRTVSHEEIVKRAR